MIFVMAHAATSPEKRSVREKARYMYTQGAVEMAAGNEDRAWEYYRRAYEIDPTYEEAASAYGSRRIVTPLDSFQTNSSLLESLDMMRRFVDRYPDDQFESQYYGFVAMHLDTLSEASRVLERTYERFPQSSAILLQLSEAYLRDANLEKAIDALSRYEQVEGLSQQVTMRKISYQLVAGDTIGAQREVSRLVEQNPTDAAVRVMKGGLFESINMPDSALIYYKEAEMLSPESVQPKAALAGYYQAIGDSVAYDTKVYEMLFTEDMGLDDKVGIVAEYLQKLLTDKQQTSRGDTLFAALRKQYPHEPQVLDLAARYSAAKGNFKEADEEISYAIDLDRTNETYWAQKMAYLAADEKYNKSIDAYHEAVKNFTPSLGLRYNYIAVANSAKRYDLARKEFKSLIAEIDSTLNPDSVLKLEDLGRNITLSDLDRLSDLYTSLGDTYHSENDTTMAYRMYDNALVLNPKNELTLNNYAYFLCIDGGSLDKARSLIEQTITLMPDNPTYLDTYAWILYKQGEMKKAEEVQSRALEKVKGTQADVPELYDHYGDILAGLGKDPDSLKMWKIAAKMMEDFQATDEDAYKKLTGKIKSAEKRGVHLPEDTDIDALVKAINDKEDN